MIFVPFVFLMLAIGPQYIYSAETNKADLMRDLQALDELGFYFEIEKKIRSALPKIEQKTKIRMLGNPIVFPPDGDGNILVSMRSDDFGTSTEVVLKNVTPENVDDKINELIAIVSADFLEQRSIVQSLHTMNQESIGGAGDGLQIFNTSVGGSLGLGSYSFARVWVELPAALDGASFDDSMFSNLRSHWVKAEILLDGTLNAPIGLAHGQNNSVAIARLITHVYEIRSDRVDSYGGAFFAVRIGSLDGAIKLENGNNPLARVDVSFLNLKGGGSVRLGEQAGLYYSLVAKFAMRVLDENKKNIQFVLGNTFTIGVMIAKKFFIESNLAMEISKKNSYLTIGGALGWKASKLVTLSAGANYSLSESQLNKDVDRDPMYIVPEGWSFTVSALSRF